MKTTLTERRKADRTEMARRLAVAVVAVGGTIASDIDWTRFHPGRAMMLRITAPGGAIISVDFDGKSVQPDTFVQTWNLERGTYRDGRALRGDDDRPTHKRNRVAYGFDHLVRLLTGDIRAFRDGTGYYPIDEAFRSWMDGHAYLDNAGNYRVREGTKGRSPTIAPWNRYARELYPDNADFHKAAHAWADDVANQKHVAMMLDGAADETERDLILRDACQ